MSSVCKHLSKQCIIVSEIVINEIQDIIKLQSQSSATISSPCCYPACAKAAILYSVNLICVAPVTHLGPCMIA